MFWGKGKITQLSKIVSNENFSTRFHRKFVCKDTGSYFETPKSNVKVGEFRSQLQASYVSSHTEELWYNETVCLWMTIYIYTPIFKLINPYFFKLS